MTDTIVEENLKQITMNECWKSLKYPELINLGKSDKCHLELLNDPETWRYLLKRDYTHPDWPLNETVDPKEYYEFLYWMGVTITEGGGTDLNFPEGAEEFIRNKFKQLVDQELQSTLTAVLFGGSHRDSCMGIIKGVNEYDLIISAIDRFRHTYSFLTFLEDYYEPEDTSFKQKLDELKRIWIDEDEDHQSHILIMPN